MTEWILIIVLLWLLEIAYFRIARYFRILDKPNDRSSHDKPTIRGGGIVIFLAAVLYTFLNGFIYPWFSIGIIIIGIVSFLDDLGHMNRFVRVVLHFITVLLLVYDISPGLNLSPWILIVMLVVATGTINATNFMDGINGITSVYGLIMLGMFAYLNTQLNFVDNNIITYVTMGLAVFTFYNFRKKAVCFAGDIGSVSLAFVLVFLTLKLIYSTGDISYILLWSVYGVDSVVTIVQRILKKENIFDAHRSHLYQYLANEYGKPHLQVSAGYGIVQVLVNFVVIINAQFIWITPVALLIAVLIVLGLFYLLYKRRLLQEIHAMKEQTYMYETDH